MKSQCQALSNWNVPLTVLFIRRFPLSFSCTLDRSQTPSCCGTRFCSLVSQTIYFRFKGVKGYPKEHFPQRRPFCIFIFQQITAIKKVGGCCYVMFYFLALKPLCFLKPKSRIGIRIRGLPPFPRHLLNISLSWEKNQRWQTKRWRLPDLGFPLFLLCISSHFSWVFRWREKPSTLLRLDKDEVASAEQDQYLVIMDAQ